MYVHGNKPLYFHCFGWYYNCFHQHQTKLKCKCFSVCLSVYLPVHKDVFFRMSLLSLFAPFALISLSKPCKLFNFCDIFCEPNMSIIVDDILLNKNVKLAVFHFLFWRVVIRLWFLHLHLVWFVLYFYVYALI